MPKRKIMAEDPSPAEGWMTSFADLMSLLCVFFILMFAMANTNLQNFARVAEALRLAFHGIGSSPVPAITDDPTDRPSSSNVPSAAAPVFAERLPPRQRDFLKVSTELTALANELGVSGQISINSSTEGTIISLSEALVFESGSANLRPEAREVLDKVVEILSSTDHLVRIEGHTDDIPTNNPLYPTNWELSVARAVSIVRYLIDEGDIPAKRLIAAGQAEFKPLVPNTNRTNRALNRRADIIIIYPNESRQISLSIPKN